VERLLKGLDGGEIGGQTRALREEVDNIADKTPESSRDSS
jgi:hypothetical protein